MNHLETEIQNLKNSMVEMASMVRSQIGKSVNALIAFDKDLAREVIFNEKRVNAFELKLDRDCENILALFTPVANDLRFVFSSLKINSDLERIGDNAEGIAQYVLQAKQKINQELLKSTELDQMINTVTLMIDDIFEAYKMDDTKIARSIFEKDQILNDINKNATKIIAEYLSKAPTDIEDTLYLLTIIRKLERVGDHITNIAEEVIFYVEAKVLKHVKVKN